MGWERIDELALATASRRVVAERELVAGMLADPVRGAMMAREVGVEAADFDQPDLRVMFLACVVVEEGAVGGSSSGSTARANCATVEQELDPPRLRVRTLRLIKRALTDEGRWNSLCRGYERGMSWSDESLVSFACSHPSCAEVRKLSKQLREIVRRIEMARECFRRMVKLLSPPLP